MSRYTYTVGQNLYSLTLTLAHTQDNDGKQIVKYSLCKNGKAIFSNTDFHASPLNPPTGKVSAGSLLKFLTVQEHDVDADYFKDYNQTQIDFRDSGDCEELSLWAMELEGEA